MKSKKRDRRACRSVICQGRPSVYWSAAFNANMSLFSGVRSSAKRPSWGGELRGAFQSWHFWIPSNIWRKEADTQAHPSPPPEGRVSPERLFPAPTSGHSPPQVERWSWQEGHHVLEPGQPSTVSTQPRGLGQGDLRPQGHRDQVWNAAVETSFLLHTPAPPAKRPLDTLIPTTWLANPSFTEDLLCERSRAQAGFGVPLNSRNLTPRRPARASSLRCRKHGDEERGYWLDRVCAGRGARQTSVNKENKPMPLFSLSLGHAYVPTSRLVP